MAIVETTLGCMGTYFAMPRAMTILQNLTCDSLSYEVRYRSPHLGCTAKPVTSTSSQGELNPLAALSNILFDHLNWIAKMSFVVQILYMPILLTTKISILLFYFRLSPNPLYKKVVKIVLCFSVAFGIAVTGADIFQCTPVAFMFDSTILGGKCINQMLFFKSTAIINIINDFVVFVLPLPTLWKLKLPNVQKVALCFILSLGVL